MPTATFAQAARDPNGFNTIRLLAAVLVIVSHGFSLTGAAEPLMLATGQASLGILAVYAFFVISGYLIPASFERGSLARFAAQRARRIMPGLVVCVALCVFVIGPVFTRLPVTDYFTKAGTWTFAGNALFMPVGYDLPGVFAGQPGTAANGSLWSLKFEVACYVAVPLLLWAKRIRAAAVLLAWAASFVAVRIIPADAAGIGFYLYNMASLFRFFGAGMVFYLFAHRIPLRTDWAWVALAATVLAGFTPLLLEVAASAGAYAMITFAHRAPGWFRAITARGDISYGVYVYAFPIQQMLVPAALATAMPWLINVALSIPLAALAGLASWVLVERPLLRRK